MYQGPGGTFEANYVDDSLLQLWELNLEEKKTKSWNIQDVTENKHFSFPSFSKKFVNSLSETSQVE